MRFPFQHRSSLFPVLIAVLSLGLLALMYYSFLYRPSTPSNTEAPVVAISSDDYRRSIRAVMDMFDQKIQVAQDVPSRRAVVQETLTALLALRVPVEYQNAHLQLAIALNAMQAGLDRQDHSIEEALAQWQSAKALFN